MTKNNAPLDGNTSFPPFLSTTQLAALLGLHPATLRQWRHKHLGPAYTRCGGAVRYERAVLVEWIKSRTHGDDSARSAGAITV